MEKQIKIFFIDLDGTLLNATENNSKVISIVNKEALLAAKAKGIKLVISTGRLGAHAHKWLKITGFDYAIIGNGSQVIDKNLKVLQEHRLSTEQVKKIVGFCEKNNLSLKIDDVSVGYGVSADLHVEIANSLNYQVFHPTYNVKFSPALKLIIWGQPRKVLDKLQQQLKKEVPDLAIVFADRGKILEVSHVQATKGKGNEFLWKKLGFTKEETAHIGDTMNDSTAIDHVGTFIAMGDSSPELLEMAEYVADVHSNHAVAKILLNNDYQLNPLKK